MDFAYDDITSDLVERLEAFMEEFVHPTEPSFFRQRREATDPWSPVPLVEELKSEARARGLWNLFLPRTHEYGAGLTNVQYAPLAEITGRALWIAPESINCSAPDTGNMELLALFGTEEQRHRWLEPLLDGEIRSAFSMTEPAVGVVGRDEHRDADHARRRRVRHQRAQVVDVGRDVAAREAADRDGRDRSRRRAVSPPEHDPRPQGHARACEIERSMSVFGYTDGYHGGHAEIVYDDVRVPVSNLLGEEGDGFRIAQERLGPGRIHHAMRTIGMAERALELMIERTAGRSTFGRPIIDQGVVQDWIAEARIRIEQARLLTLKTAWLMDTVGNKGARIEISAIKVAAPAVATWVIDRAMQAHGAGGLSQDFVLAEMYAVARSLQIADGPDEVHRMAIARREIKGARSRVLA